MKHKAGDKVICITLNEEYKHYEISNVEVDSVVLYKDKIEYFLSDWGDPINEDEIYTPTEAIEFVTNYINKND